MDYPSHADSRNEPRLGYGFGDGLAYGSTVYRALKPAAVIVTAGVAIRLALLLFIVPGLGEDGDQLAYVSDAQRILAGVWPSGVRPPLYPLLLACTLPIARWFPLVVQSAMTIGSGLLVGRRNYIAGLLIAACPFTAYFDLRLVSESLYINLVIWAWLSGTLGAGILLGLAILARDTLLLLPAFSFLILRTKQAAKTAAIAYLCILPGIALNGSLSQGRMGLNLWVGTWERNSTWYANGLDRPAFPSYAFTTKAEEQSVKANWNNDLALRRLAVERVESHPWQTALVWIERYPRLWLGTRLDAGSWSIGKGALWTLIKATGFALNLALLLFGLWGLMLPDRFAIPVLYTALVYIPFHNTETRYSLVALPFLIWLGARRALLMWDGPRHADSWR